MNPNILHLVASILKEVEFTSAQQEQLKNILFTQLLELVAPQETQEQHDENIISLADRPR